MIGTGYGSKGNSNIKTCFFGIYSGGYLVTSMKVLGGLSSIRTYLEELRKTLSPLARSAKNSRQDETWGRCDVRTDFQRIDRIIYSRPSDG